MREITVQIVMRLHSTLAGDEQVQNIERALMRKALGLLESGESASVRTIKDRKVEED